MKIATASDGINISGHFGHCEGFHIFEIENIPTFTFENTDFYQLWILF